jgi:malonyl-CoA O-methyltransferase
MLQALNAKLRKAFSESADQYDILASLHREIGRELVKKTTKFDAATILDVGCGTGYVANKAKFFFPESRIVGLDLAEGMLEKAQEKHEGIAIDWVQGDAARLPFKKQSIDLVLSNFAYQWIDLPQSFKEVKRVLTPKGSMYITLFGFKTCQELFESLGFVLPKKNFARLPSLDDVQKALADAGILQAHVDYELIKVQFKDVLELLGWLKAIGANNLSDDIFLGKNALTRVQEFYRTRYPYHDGICASFEVIWVEAKGNG